jgi:drug/metabolite transporter (DMT)-like permease
MDRTQRDGALLLILAALGYSFLPVLTKFGYSAGLEPRDLLTWRFIIAAPLVWLLLAVRRPTGGTPLPRVRLLLMGALFAASALCAFFSLERIPASTYTVLLYCYPAFVALLSLLVGDRLSRFGWLALALTLVGVVLTVPNLGADLARSDPLGMLLAMLNGASYAVYIVISNRLLKADCDLQSASALSITGSFLALVLLALAAGLRVPATLEGWLSIVAMAIFATVVPIFAFYAGLRRLGAPRAAILSTLEPVLVLAWSFMLLRETMLPLQVVGAAFILASAILLQLRGTPAPEPAAVTAAGD